MSAGKAIHILVADDNEINQRVIRGMLEHRGYSVSAVHTGSEVLAALESAPYDLVIMDCLMPVMDGYEATRAIRTSDSAAFDSDIPVLAITALAAPGDRERCLESGMNDYISKPVVADHLFRKLHQLLDSDDIRDKDSGPCNDDPVPGLLSSLSGKLVSELEAWSAELKTLDPARSLEYLGHIAHKIRGSADVFGEKDLSVAAARLESAAREGDLPAAPGLRARLEDELQRLSERLRGK